MAESAQPVISLIVAAADNGVIGRRGVHNLLWHQRADQRYFRELTMGHPMIMGRTTFETFAKPLPGRLHIIITRDQDYRVPEGCVVVHSIDEALQAARATGTDEVFVIGGASIYEQALPLANKIYLTRIHAQPEGDAFFRYNPAEWVAESTAKSYPADDENDHPYSFIVLIRRTT